MWIMYTLKNLVITSLFTACHLFSAKEWLKSMLSYNSTWTYCKTSNIRGTLVGNKIVDHSDVVAAAPTISSFST